MRSRVYTCIFHFARNEIVLDCSSIFITVANVFMASLARHISQNAITDQMFISNGLDSALGEETWIFSKKDLDFSIFDDLSNSDVKQSQIYDARLCTSNREKTS